MKRIFIIIAFTFAVLPLIGGEARSQQGATQNNVEQELLKLEREWLDAYEKRDVAAMERIVADDFTITFDGGHMSTKAQTIADLKRPRPVDPTLKFSTEDVKVRVYGDTAILSGRVIEKRQRNNREVVSQSRYTDTYVRRNGRWQVVASHLSRLPPQRAAISVDPKVYDAYVGQYELAPNRILTITKEGNALFGQPTGQAKSELFPETEARFFVKGADVLLTFVRDEKGQASHLVVQDGNQTAQVVKKIK